jgi:hypothetical protein
MVMVFSDQNLVPSHKANTTISVPLPKGTKGNLTLVAGVPSVVGVSFCVEDYYPGRRS